MAQAFRANTGTPTNQASQNPIPNLPQTLQAQTQAEKFFASSGYNDTILNQSSLIPNSNIQFNLINTGLTDKLLLDVSGSISYANTSISPQDVVLSPEFPLNTISQIQIQYNGNITIIQASPYELASLNALRSKSGFLQDGFGGLPSQNNSRISRRKASVTAGADITLKTGDGLTGYNGFTVAGSKTGVLNFRYVVEIPFVWRHDIPIGILALQNNSIICQANVSSPAMLGTSPLSPTYVAGTIPSTLSTSTASINVTPVQYYWETPSDSKLYQYFVANSYMFISVPSQKINATGNKALQYLMPNNYILTKMLFTIRDANAKLLDCVKDIQNPMLNYNNTTSVDMMPMSIREYLQEMHYECPPTAFGQLAWDACTHAYDANNMSDSSFLDLYQANNPQFYADVVNSIAVPATFSIAREMIIPSNVRQA